MNNPGIIKAAIIISFLFILGEVLSGPLSHKRMRKQVDKRRFRDMHVLPDKRLLRRRPRKGEVLLGKVAHVKRRGILRRLVDLLRGKYACWRIKDDFHELIIGGSGSGKTSTSIIPLLLNNPDTPALVMDIKGELSMKSRRLDDDRVCVVNPADRTSYGFDPLYSLEGNVTLQEVKEVAETIANTLITVPSNAGGDAYWYTSARSMLTALLGYYIMQQPEDRRDFIDAIDSILKTPIKKQKHDIYQQSYCLFGENSFIHELMAEYQAIDDAQLGSIYSNVAIALSPFADEGLRYTFSKAKNKVSPLTLEGGKSVFLAVPDYKLDAYSGPIGMIIALTLGELSKREESKKNKILVVIDELGTISSKANLTPLVTASMLYRSKGIRLIMAVQQIESLLSGFKEHDVTTLVGNCNVKVILDASSSRTQKMVCEDWVGQYVDIKKSTSEDGKRHSTTDAYELKNLLVPGDLTELVANGESVVVTPCGFSMLKKCKYYEDKHFKREAAKILDYNKAIVARKAAENETIRKTERENAIRELEIRKRNARQKDDYDEVGDESYLEIEDIGAIEFCDFNDNE